MTFGLRYSVDTNRENNSVPNPTCADLSSTVAYVCSGLSGTQTIASLFNPSYTQLYINQPYKNLGPQVGLNYSPGDHKTVSAPAWVSSTRASSSTTVQTPSPASPRWTQSYVSKNPCTSSSITYPDGSVKTTTPDGTPFATMPEQDRCAISRTVPCAGNAVSAGHGRQFAGDERRIPGQHAQR